MRAIVLFGIFTLTVGICIAASLTTVRFLISAERTRQQSTTSDVINAASLQLSDSIGQIVEAATVLDGVVQSSYEWVAGAPASASDRVLPATLNFTWTMLNDTTVGLRGIGFGAAFNWTQVVLCPNTPPFSAYSVAFLNSLPPQTGVTVLRRDMDLYMDVIRPVANCSRCRTFWGIVGVRFSLSDVLPRFFNTFTAQGYAAALIVPDFSGTPIVMGRSDNAPSALLSPDVTVSVNVSHFTASESAMWTVLVWRLDGFAVFAGSSSVSACVVGSFAAGVIAVILALFIDVCCCGAADQKAVGLSADIPLDAPYFVIAAEIDRAAQVWPVEPQFASDMQRHFLEAVNATEHHCHIAHHMGERMLVVCKNACDALNFAAAQTEWASAQRWPETVSVTLGRTIPFRLRIVLHYCEDATGASIDGTTGSFGGPDIDLACELRSFAPAGHITVSQPFFEAAQREKVPEEQFVYLGTSIPNDDGRSFDGYVYVGPNGNGNAALDLSTSAAEFWTKNELVADAFNDGAKRSASAARPLIRGRSQTDAASVFSGADSSSGDVHRHSSLASSRVGRKSITAVSARQMLIDAVVNHPVFLRLEHANWLPAKTCDGGDTKKLHHLLQEYVTTQDEANNYSTLLALSTYFFQVYTFILRPLALAEQRNIIKRLQMTFGIPERSFAHRLAVQCAVIGFRALPSRAVPSAASDGRVVHSLQSPPHHGMSFH